MTEFLDKLTKHVDDITSDLKSLEDYPLAKQFHLQPWQVKKFLLWDLEQDKLSIKLQAKEYTKRQASDPCVICDGSGINKGGPWLNAQDELITACNVCNGSKMYTAWGFEKQAFEAGYPFYGSFGGVHTYTFIPTCLGIEITVRHGYTKNELDLSDC